MGVPPPQWCQSAYLPGRPPSYPICARSVSWLGPRSLLALSSHLYPFQTRPPCGAIESDLGSLQRAYLVLGASNQHWLQFSTLLLPRGGHGVITSCNF